MSLPGRGRGVSCGAVLCPLGMLTDPLFAETEETLLYHVPRRAPASLLPSGMGLGDTCTQRVALDTASIPDERGWAPCCSELLIRDIRAWLGIRSALIPECTNSGSSHKTFLLQLNSVLPQGRLCLLQLHLMDTLDKNCSWLSQLLLMDPPLLA